MKKINYEIGYTHAGIFHYDDVMSTAFLKILYPNIKIIRVNNITVEILNRENTIIYDIGNGKFDHHQNDVAFDRFGNKYCAFGLLWQEFGREFLKQQGFVNVEDAFLYFEEHYVTKINYGDNNGYKPGYSLNEQYTIKKFNPSWYEKEFNSDIENIQFNKAVDASKSFLENYLREVYDEVELVSIDQKIWESADKYCNGRIIYLEHPLKWHKIKNKGDVVAFITKNQRGGYMVSIDPLAAFKFIKDKTSGVNYYNDKIIFVKTKEQAIEITTKIITHFNL